MVITTGVKLLILLTVSSAWAQKLRLCDPLLNVPSRSGSPITYDGHGSIYFIADSDTTPVKMNLTNYGMQRMQELAYFRSTGAVDKDGNAFYLGGLTGWPMYSIKSVYKYDNANLTAAPRFAGNLVSAISDRHPVVTIGDVIYVFAGRNIEAYNTISNTATILTQLPTPYPEAVAYDGIFVYLFGGSPDGFSYSNHIFRFDPNTHEVKEMRTRLPYSLRNFAVAIVDNVAYIIGGYNSNVDHKDILLYNIKKEVLTRLPEQLNVDPSAAIYVKEQRRIYIFEDAFDGPHSPMCIEFPPEA